MKPYDPKATCEKCGCKKIHSLYMEETYEYNTIGGSSVEHEYILRRCERCGYTWNEEPLKGKK